MLSRHLLKGLRSAAQFERNLASAISRRTFTVSTTSQPLSSQRASLLALGGGILASAAFLSWNSAKAEEASAAPAAGPAAANNATPTDHKVVKYKYVIVGAGTAGFAAMKKLRELEPGASILLVGAEGDQPYIRPPLSKELWKSADPKVAENLKFTAFDGTEASAYLANSAEDFKGVDLMLNTRATDLDPARKAILLSEGTIVEYDKLLIATGGKPNWLPTVSEATGDRVSTYRTLEDFRRMDRIAREAEHVVVVGGGFLGTELTVGLGLRGKPHGLKVTQVMPEPGVMSMVFPEYLSQLATDVVRKEAGATVLTGRLVADVEPTSDGRQVELTLDDGRKLQADHVVLAVGIRPNTLLAERGDLELDAANGGILVNSELQARTGIYAAGDVASFYDRTLGRRRVEHHDHAVHSGELAATNMTGKAESYSHLPFFWGDIGSLGYEAVGQIDSRLDTVGVWVKPEGAADDAPPTYERGVVYYLSPKDQTVRGVLLWHEFGKVDEARRIIKRGRAFPNAADLKTQITLDDDAAPEAPAASS
eukprot:TRINITY_DN7101_c0_g1_i1.p2 TRINITY_DN7101_c0_g1~~TRINITY_DN7101_c0_g1_i1.p2  ORF type:complete len:538 (+),score=214.62 TRINITY_DN7101_c0_g1_i1:79-1692(+)